MSWRQSVKQSISQTVTQRSHRVLDQGRDETTWGNWRGRSGSKHDFRHTHESKQSNVCTIIASTENAFPHNITSHKAKTQDISCSSAQLNNVSHRINCLKLTFNIIFFLIFQVEDEPWCVMKQFFIFFSIFVYTVSHKHIIHAHERNEWAYEHEHRLFICAAYIFIQLNLPQ